MPKDKWIWSQNPETFTKEQKERVLKEVVETMVQTVFKTHFYRWDGRIFRLTGGGPIGLRASGVVAKVAMECWIGMLSEKLREYGIREVLLCKYVDDVIILVEKVELGT